MYDNNAALFSLQPVAHAGHNIWYEGEGRRVVVREWIVIYAVVNLTIRIAGAFGAELPYRPVFAMFRVEELHEGVERVSICTLWIGAARA